MDPSGIEGGPPTTASPPGGAPRPRAALWIRAVARHRLTHFLLLGGALFALAPSPERQREIRIDQEHVAALRADEARKLGKAALSPEEARRVDSRAIEDELLYREAQRLGIDEGDIVVRQRLIQKLLVLAEDMDGASRPLTDAELRACLAARPEKWRLPAEVRLVHIYAASREALSSLREQATAWSADPAREGEAPPLGESFPLNRRVAGSIDTIEATYGSGFASAVKQLPIRVWSEPLPSKFGWHLVRVLEAQAERPAEVSDVRIALAMECQIKRREEAVRRYLSRLFPDYKVYVGGERALELVPTERTAPRAEMSGED